MLEPLVIVSKKAQTVTVLLHIFSVLYKSSMLNKNQQFLDDKLRLQRGFDFLKKNKLVHSVVYKSARVYV